MYAAKVRTAWIYVDDPDALTATTSAAPGAVRRWIGCQLTSPASRCQLRISSIHHVPDWLVSAKYRSSRAPHLPGVVGRCRTDHFENDEDPAGAQRLCDASYQRPIGSLVEMMEELGRGR